MEESAKTITGANCYEHEDDGTYLVLLLKKGESSNEEKPGKCPPIITVEIAKM